MGNRSNRSRLLGIPVSPDKRVGLGVVLAASVVFAGSVGLRSIAGRDAQPTQQPSSSPASQASSSSVPIVAQGRTFSCTPTRVWDGDGPIWCAEGPRIRLAGIAAREMDGTCRSGQPCPAASAEAARDYLVSLIGRRTGVAPEGHIVVEGEPLQCSSDGSGAGTRTAAWCSNSTAGDLSHAMVRSGLALRWERYWRE